MGVMCRNPYCDFPDSEVRSPSVEELLLWESQADEEVRDQLKKGEVTLMICDGCGTWTAERWNDKEKRIMRGYIPSPYHFDLGDRLNVILEGKTLGMVGQVTRRTRLVKTIDPPPVPENYYYLVFEDSQHDGNYGENHLEPIK